MKETLSILTIVVGVPAFVWVLVAIINHPIIVQNNAESYRICRQRLDAIDAGTYCNAELGK